MFHLLPAAAARRHVTRRRAAPAPSPRAREFEGNITALSGKQESWDRSRRAQSQNVVSYGL